MKSHTNEESRQEKGWGRRVDREKAKNEELSSHPTALIRHMFASSQANWDYLEDDMDRKSQTATANNM